MTVTPPPWLEPQDLLGQRRLERGLPERPAPLSPARPLIIQGASIGIGALTLVLLASAGLALRQAQVEAEVASMSGVPGRVQALEGQVRAERGRLDPLQRSTEALARGLVAVGSGSALLTQLARITPQGVQLSDVSVTGQAVLLKGSAEDPAPLARINAFSLLLASSPLFKPGEVRVVKVTREAAAPSSTVGAAAQSQGRVTWELSAALAELPAARQLPLLRTLGADGMATRLTDLMRTGVLR